ncbi:hypothetical protein PENTCL1PPCAC_24995, partial [Pristionchus entomophagus]
HSFLLLLLPLVSSQCSNCPASACFRPPPPTCSRPCPQPSCPSLCPPPPLCPLPPPPPLCPLPLPPPPPFCPPRLPCPLSLPPLPMPCPARPPCPCSAPRWQPPPPPCNRGCGDGFPQAPPPPPTFLPSSFPQSPVPIDSDREPLPPLPNSIETPPIGGCGGGPSPLPALPRTPAHNDCCHGCNRPCRYRRRRLAVHGAKSRVVDPSCSSEQLGDIILENISADSSSSKRAIQTAAQTALRSLVDVVCGTGEFSYVAHTHTFCQRRRGDVTCYAFVPIHNREFR